MYAVRVRDRSPVENHAVLPRARSSHFPTADSLDSMVSPQVWNHLMGDLASWAVERSRKMPREKVESEKRWLLGRLGLLPD